MSPHTLCDDLPSRLSGGFLKATFAQQYQTVSAIQKVLEVTEGQGGVATSPIPAEEDKGDSG